MQSLILATILTLSTTTLAQHAGKRCNTFTDDHSFEGEKRVFGIFTIAIAVDLDINQRNQNITLDLQVNNPTIGSQLKRVSRSLAMELASQNDLRELQKLGGAWQDLNCDILFVKRLTRTLADGYYNVTEFDPALPIIPNRGLAGQLLIENGTDVTFGPIIAEIIETGNGEHPWLAAGNKINFSTQISANENLITIKNLFIDSPSWSAYQTEEIASIFKELRISGQNSGGKVEIAKLGAKITTKSLGVFDINLKAAE